MQNDNVLKTIELISASAGTGKTYRLTERIVEAVREGVRPESIMATTFTVKAAAELRDRVRESLVQQGLAELGVRIEGAYIGTVHSLCFRLLREYAIDAGISPDVKVLPESDRDRLFNIAVETALADMAGIVEPPARRMGRTGEGSGYAREDDWRGDVRKIVGAARANGIDPVDLRGHASDALERWRQVIPDESTGVTVSDLIREAEAAIQQLETIEEPLKGTASVLEVLRQFRAEYSGTDPDGSPAQSVGRSAPPWKTWVELAELEPRRDGAGMIDGLCRVASRVCEAPEFAQDFQTLIEGVYSCAAEALDLYSEFKRARGLTDYDDLERSLLWLLTDNRDVQQGIRDRIDIVMVDEFQDTSPMQLALFLELHRVIGRSVWVGDPKQAIYGFRGTDPALMAQVERLLDSRETLSRSWRSRQAILDITNAIFTQVLHDTPKEQVALALPDTRMEEGQGGSVGVWYLDSANKGEDAAAVAEGVRTFLAEHPERTPGDIALLCRGNDYCNTVAGALNEAGIRTSVATGSLNEARETQIIIAALRCIADGADTLALTELIVLLSARADLLSALISSPEETLSQWRTESVPAELIRLVEGSDALSIVEAVDTAIAVTDLVRIASAWSKPDVRRGNIEVLRKLAREYEDLHRADNTPASLHGFVASIEESDEGQAPGTGPDSCVVTTYHGAKGLEWPVVILTELDKTYRASPFGVHVIPAERFDPAHPLAERRIHFWPWPFGTKKKFAALDETLEATPVQRQIRRAAHEESVRLLYVGSTRPRESLILAVRNRSSQGPTKAGDAWLRHLTDRNGNPLFQWPSTTGDVLLPIGEERVPVAISVQAPRAFGANASGERPPAADRGTLSPTMWPVRDVPDGLPRLPRVIVPSDFSDEDFITAAVERAVIASPIPVTRQPSVDDPDSTALGNAVHAVFACAPLHRIPGKTGDILHRWGVDVEIADAVNLSVDELESFLEQHYTITGMHREWPVFARLESGQEMHGWIDLLAETPRGWVIVDHKTYRGSDPATEAARYGGQLACYRQAVERATGTPVVDTLINFVLLGVVYGV